MDLCLALDQLIASSSGAPLEEAISWSKAKHKSNLVTVIGDTTILFPLIYAGAMDHFKQI